jgi:hypothetical protein
VDSIGFNPPTLPDSAEGPELDIYLAAVGAGQAYVEPEAFPEVDLVVGDGQSGTPVYMAIDQDLPDAWVASFVAHEFNHVLQYATDFTEFTLPIWEGTATAAQTWTLGPDGEWDYDVYTFQEAAHSPALLGDSGFVYPMEGLGYMFEYGAALWVMHLDQVLGSGDGTMGAALWAATANEGRPNEPDVLEAVATASGLPYGSFLNSLARSRWLVGPEWDPRGIPDAKDWGWWERIVFARLETADLPATHVPWPAPQITGVTYLEVVDLDTVPPATLEVEVESRDGLLSAVIVMTWASDGSVGEAEAWGEDPSVSVPTEGLDRVVIGLTNMGAADFDGDSWPYRDGDQVLHLALGPPPVAETGDTGRVGDTGKVGPPDTGAGLPGDSQPTHTGGGDTGPGSTGTTSTPGTTEPTPTETTEPTTTTETTPTEAPPAGPDTGDSAPSKDGCGCSAGPDLRASGLVLLVLFAVRRRRLLSPPRR